jgi:hypothetical protein
MQIRIELDERDPPTGRVRLGDGPAHPFTGWLGLLGEMAALLDGGGVADDEQVTDDDRGGD